MIRVPCVCDSYDKGSTRSYLIQMTNVASQVSDLSYKGGTPVSNLSDNGGTPLSDECQRWH